jgi:hypothetical protein
MARVVDVTIASSNRLARGARPLPTQVVGALHTASGSRQTLSCPPGVSSRNEQMVQILGGVGR